MLFPMFIDVALVAQRLHVEEMNPLIPKVMVIEHRRFAAVNTGQSSGVCKKPLLNCSPNSITGRLLGFLGRGLALALFFGFDPAALETWSPQPIPPGFIKTEKIPGAPSLTACAPFEAVLKVVLILLKIQTQATRSYFQNSDFRTHESDDNKHTIRFQEVLCPQR